MGRRLVAVACLGVAGCLSAPPSEDPDAGGEAADGGGGGGSRCQPFAEAPAQGELAGAFVDPDGALAADIDGDGDRDLLLHGATPLGSWRLVVARMPQSKPLRFHWQVTTDGPVAVAVADLVGGDGCAELVVAGTGGPTTPLSIFGQDVSGDDVFRELSTRDLEVDASSGLSLVADPGLGGGAPAIALATPTTLHALPPDALLEGAAVPTYTAPDFAAIRWIAPVARDDHSDLLVAEDGRVRWMAPVLPGGQLQFEPLRIVSLAIDPVVHAGGADLDGDGEADDVFCAGDDSLALALDGSVDPPVVATAPAAMEAACPPFEATGIGRLGGDGERDAVAIDACSDTTAVTVLLDARVAAGPALDGTRVDGLVDGAAAHLAVIDQNGDGMDEAWTFDQTGAGRCLAIDGVQLVSCD